MPHQRPEGYYFARSDDGALTIHENSPGKGACRIHWKPTGNFEEDREHEFRISIDNWNKIVAQKVHEMKLKQAEAEVAVAKVKKHGATEKANISREEASDPGF